MNKREANVISLEGKIAMVTGSASGIGRGIAKVLSEAGATIYAVDYDFKLLLDLKKSFEERGKEIRVLHYDLSSRGEVQKLWDEIKNAEPDILVNNVGLYQFRDFLEVDEEFLDRAIDVNLKSCFWMCQFMIKRNIERGRGGTIVNISSVEAVLPFIEGLTHYTASKAGVIAVTRALAKEYARKGFRVNAILPGGIVTPGTKNIAKKALMKFDISILKSGRRFWDRLPSRTLGKPEDIGKVVLALVSDLFSYVHGAVIPVDGGFLSA
ncbi:MAG: SDR family NAD(P)-dependent oxidoreductase [Brevinematia bacterium]